jgi:NAD-dependent dihydropyrimidine dehydrogenase PreA subunit
MILYFTGTGNSFDVAKRLSKDLGDELISLNKRMSSYKNEPFTDVHRFVFVLPIYAGRIPRPVEEFIRYSNFRGSRDVYFIVTCFASPFHALYYLKKLCKYKEWHLRGFDYLKMPIGYLPKFKPLSEKEEAKVLEKAHHHTEKISRDIEGGHPFFHSPKIGAFMSLSGNRRFYRHGIDPQEFHANDRCIHCGTCVMSCPLHNIKLEKGFPVWGDNCMSCMACLNDCPEEAIDFKNRTKGKRRYINPDYHPF